MRKIVITIMALFLVATNLVSVKATNPIATDAGLRATILDKNSKPIQNPYYTSQKADTYYINIPKLLLATDTTAAKTYELTVLDSRYVNTILAKPIPTTSGIITSEKIYEEGTNKEVGDLVVELTATGSIVVKYIFDQTPQDTSYRINSYPINFTTKEIADEVYTFLPSSTPAYQIEHYDFALKPDNNNGTNNEQDIFTVEPVPNYKFDINNIEVTVPSGVIYTQQGNQYIFKLDDTTTSSMGTVTFKDKLTNRVIYSALTLKKPDAPKDNVTSAIEFSKSADNSTLEVIVTLTGEPDVALNAMPTSLTIKNLTLKNSPANPTYAFPDDEKLILNHNQLEEKPIENGIHQYVLKANEEIVLNATPVEQGNNKVSVFKLALPITQWMKYEHLYNDLQLDLNYTYDYKTPQTVNDSTVLPLASAPTITFKSDAVMDVEPNDKGEYHLLEYVRIYTNNVELDNNSYFELKDHAFMYPTNIKDENKIYFVNGSIKADGSGFDHQFDDGTTSRRYAEGTPRFVKVMEKENGVPTGNFHYEFTILSKLKEAPKSFGPYYSDQNPAKFSATVDYQFNGTKGSQTIDQRIRLVVAPYEAEKVVLDKRVAADGKGQITKWAIVYNRNHKNKGIIQLQDKIKNGTLVDNTLQYYFINPEQIKPLKKDLSNLKDMLPSFTSYPISQDKTQAGPYYFTSNNNSEFTIKFGDHSDILKQKFAEIQQKYEALYPNNDIDRLENIAIDQFKYLFKDYQYLQGEIGDTLNSNGSYFTDTNQVALKRHFPEFSMLQPQSSATLAERALYPFTSLVDNYVTVTRTSKSSDVEKGVVEYLPDTSVKGDALVVVYETYSTGNAANEFKATSLKELPYVAMIEPLIGGPGAVPQFVVDGKPTTTSTAEGGSEVVAEVFYKTHKHSFIQNDTTWAKNGLLMNLNGNFVEEITVKDVPVGSYGVTIGANYNAIELYQIKLNDFNRAINQLKTANPQNPTEDVLTYEKRLLDEFIKQVYEGNQQTILTPINALFSADNRSFSYKTNMTQENHEYVFLWLYSMDVSHDFSAARYANQDVYYVNNTTNLSLANYATVTYDGKAVTVDDSLNFENFIKRAEINIPVQPNYWKKTFQVTLDLSKYKLANVADEIVIEDRFIAVATNGQKEIIGSDHFQIVNPLIYGKQLDATNFEPVTTGISLSHEVVDNKVVFKIQKDPQVDFDSILNIVYDFEYDRVLPQNIKDISEIVSSSLATVANKNTPMQTIKDADIVSSSAKNLGIKLEKAVNVTRQSPRDDWKRHERIYHLKITLDEEARQLGNSKIMVKDNFGHQQQHVTYDEKPILLSCNTDMSCLIPTSEMEVKVVSNANDEIVYEITKHTAQFPSEFYLSYRVSIDINRLLGNYPEYDLKNYASIILQDNQKDYIASAMATTPLLKGAPTVARNSLNIHLTKHISPRKTSQGNVPIKPTDFAFELSGTYHKGGQVETLGPIKYFLGDSRSLKFINLPYDGEYTIKELIENESAQYYEPLHEIKFKIDKAGKAVIFDVNVLVENQVEVSAVEDDFETIYPKTVVVNGQTVANPDRTKEIHDVVSLERLATFKRLDLELYNTPKAVDKHNISFTKLDATTKQPLAGAKFSISKQNPDGSITALKDPADPTQDWVVTSGVDGLVRFDNLPNNLANERYLIYEIAAPNSYVLDGPKLVLPPITLTSDMVADLDYSTILNQKRLHSYSFKKVAIIKDHHGNILDPKPAAVGIKFALMHKGSRGYDETFQIAVSDANGKVEFTNIPSGTYWIREVDAFGHTPILGRVIDNIVIDEKKPLGSYNHFTGGQVAKVDEKGNVVANEMVTIEPIVIENEKQQPSFEFIKYQEAKPLNKPMAGVKFILQVFENGQYVDATDFKGNPIIVTSDTNGLVRFENLDYKKYQIIEAPHKVNDTDPVEKTNDFKDHIVSDQIIQLDFTKVPAKEKTYKLADEAVSLSKGEQFVNPYYRQDFSFKKVNEKDEVMKDIEFKLYDIKSLSQLVQVAKSDENGIVTFTNLPNGTYRVVETKVAGYRYLSFDVTLTKAGVKFPTEVKPQEMYVVKNRIEIPYFPFDPTPTPDKPKPKPLPRTGVSR